ncbi:citrate lyase beta subunit [Athelia psychrophila]|uniref:Citrate lyase beta subunit n=1 Tax=Athelia psychrophila TaxID=1759441 RepID=A0A166U8G7_9AGAM|nr:citrate lyase beta subunit [Fibularhizoctonia sp. CBS 109695]
MATPTQPVIRFATRKLHTQPASGGSLRRSYLYVPASSDRMLEKSLLTKSDVIIYDLEDSVPPSTKDKDAARNRLKDFIAGTSTDKLPRPERIAVRLNDISTPHFKHDIAQALSIPSIRTLILPKIHSAQDLHHVSREIYMSRQSGSSDQAPLNIVASIESARALWGLGDIAGWQSEYGPEGGKLSAVLFASEDYCADTSIIRTDTRKELLYTRSQIVVAAKAFGVDAIDMVCINYKDLDYLKEECEDGRRLGFNGKQAIHPSQVELIQSTFVPTSKDILRAAKILHQMEKAYALEKGAFGLDLEGGGKEMIDAPMLKQAVNTIQIAKAAGIEIPRIEG